MATFQRTTLNADALKLDAVGVAPMRPVWQRVAM